MRPYRNPRAAHGREASAWAPLFCRHKRRPCKPGCSLTSARTRRTGSSEKHSSPEITALSVPDKHTWPAKQPSAATPAGRTRPVRLLVVFAVRLLPRPRRPRRVGGAPPAAASRLWANLVAAPVPAKEALAPLEAIARAAVPRKGSKPRRSRSRAHPQRSKRALAAIRCRDSSQRPFRALRSPFKSAELRP